MCHYTVGNISQFLIRFVKVYLLVIYIHYIYIYWFYNYAVVYPDLLVGSNLLIVRIIKFLLYLFSMCFLTLVCSGSAYIYLGIF